MVRFYSDKENLYLSEEIINVKEHSYTEMGIFMELANKYPNYLSLEDFLNNKKEDAQETKEAIQSLLKKD